MAPFYSYVSVSSVTVNQHNSETEAAKRNSFYYLHLCFSNRDVKTSSVKKGLFIKGTVDYAMS